MLMNRKGLEKKKIRELDKKKKKNLKDSSKNNRELNKKKKIVKDRDFTL